MKGYSVYIYILCWIALVLGYILDFDAKTWGFLIMVAVTGLYARDFFKK